MDEDGQLVYEEEEEGEEKVSSLAKTSLVFLSPSLLPNLPPFLPPVLQGLFLSGRRGLSNAIFCSSR